MIIIIILRGDLNPQPLLNTAFSIIKMSEGRSMDFTYDILRASYG
jgi:hypothetical protein